MTKDRIIDEYFEWLSSVVDGGKHPRHVSFCKLLHHLHNTEFRYVLRRDQNMADAGIDLRYRFAIMNGYEDISDRVVMWLDGPCSILEMMVALSIYCEEHIMDDPNIGNRTGQWFWGMIVNLGLGSMSDNRFNCAYVDEVLDRFLERDYEPDGRGGLFTIRNCNQDLRNVEIFYQLCWYINTIT